MHRILRIGIIGDYNPNSRNHAATDEALRHAAAQLSISLTTDWIPTRSLAEGDFTKTLKTFHALWGAPGSPYRSMTGALKAIRFARERLRPFMGT